MIDFNALMLKAESELLSDDSLMRTVKTGILFNSLAAAMKRYGRTQVSNTEVVAVLEIIARHGKLYESLEITELQPQKIADNSRNAQEIVVDDTLPDLSPEEIFEQENVRAVLKAQYPTWSDEEIEAVVKAQAMSKNPNVVARTDEELARQETDQRDPFPGAPRGKVLDGFTMTDHVITPSDLGPTQS